MGFWGTLGTIAGDIGGTFIGDPLLGNQIAGVVNAARGQPSAPLTPLQKQTLGPLQQTQQAALTTGQNLLNMGQGVVQQPVNYWSSILSGNRGAITSALAPELSQISQGYNTAARTSAALNPRGGPSASFLSQLPFQQQRDVSTLFQQARPQAASTLAGTGGGLLNAGANTLATSTAAGRDILNTAAQQAQQSAQNQHNMGTGLFDLVQKYGPEILKKLGLGGGKSMGDILSGVNPSSIPDIGVLAGG